MAEALAALLYAVMWVGYLQQWSWLTAIDEWSLRSMHSIGVSHPAWVSAWNWVCTIGSPAVFRLLTVVLIVWLLIRREARPALFLVFSVELSGVLTELAKTLAGRPRPATALVEAWSTSFPSGHALGVLVSVLALLAVLLPRLGASWQAPLKIAGAVIVVVIGVGRVVLNVHHPSDVIAGWALGYLYYLACLPLLTAKAEKPAELGTTT